MGQIKVMPEDAQSIWGILADVRSSFPPDFRRRQGKQWYDHWRSRVADKSLVTKLADNESVARLFFDDAIGEEYMKCETMDAFLSFVDTEATGDWTSEYDTEISDLILEGFLSAANANYRFLTPKAVPDS